MKSLVFAYLAMALVAFLLYFFTYPLERMAKDHFRPKVSQIKWGALAACGFFLLLAIYQIISAHPLGL